MARSAHVQKHHQTTEPPVPGGPALRLVQPHTATDLRADPAKPTFGVHHGVIAVAMVGVLLFLLAIPVFFSGDLGDDLDLLGVGGFALIFFTLTLGLARRAARERRWGGADKESFAEFVEGNVAIATGRIASREALVQILILPATLGFGMLAIALVFALSR